MREDIQEKERDYTFCVKNSVMNWQNFFAISEFYSKERKEGERNFRMKKKYLCGGVILVLIVICIIYATTIISKNAETGNLIIKHNLFSDYTYEIYDDHIKLIFYNNANAKKVVIPDTILGKPVTEIGKHCFSKIYTKENGGCDRKFETVIMGKNVKVIGDSAFTMCDSLEEVLGEANISTIDEYAFEGCKNLSRVEFRMERIEMSAFANCKLLQEINKDSNITYIGDYAFERCEQLTDIGNQKSLEYVGNMAFNESGIETFETNCNTTFGFSVFADTPFIRNTSEVILNGVLLKYSYDSSSELVELPEGITSVDSNFLHGDISKLDKLYIPDTVTEIKGYICFGQEKKFTIYIPDSVVQIGHDYEDGAHVGIDTNVEKIVTTEGSYAQQYAKEHQIPCEIVDHIEMPEE